MQRVRRGGSEFGIAPRKRDAVFRQGRIVIGVHKKMHCARVIGLFTRDLFENGRSL